MNQSKILSGAIILLAVIFFVYKAPLLILVQLVLALIGHRLYKERYYTYIAISSGVGIFFPVLASLLLIYHPAFLGQFILSLSYTNTVQNSYGIIEMISVVLSIVGCVLIFLKKISIPVTSAENTTGVSNPQPPINSSFIINALILYGFTIFAYSIFMKLGGGWEMLFLGSVVIGFVFVIPVVMAVILRLFKTSITTAVLIGLVIGTSIVIFRITLPVITDASTPSYTFISNYGVASANYSSYMSSVGGSLIFYVLFSLIFIGVYEYYRKYHNSKNRIIIIVISILTLAILLFATGPTLKIIPAKQYGSAFLPSTNTVAKQPNNSLNPYSTPVKVTTSGSIVGWKTYEDSQMGISFKYPSSWPTPSYYGIDGPGNPYLTVQESRGPMIIDIEIGHKISDGRTCADCVAMSFDKAVSSFGPNLGITSPNYKSSVIELNGKTYALFTTDGSGGTAVIFIPNSISPNNYAKVDYNLTDLDTLYLFLENFSFIGWTTPVTTAPTLTFTTDNLATSTWQTYISKEGNFSFQYPKAWGTPQLSGIGSYGYSVSQITISMGNRTLFIAWGETKNGIRKKIGDAMNNIPGKVVINGKSYIATYSESTNSPDNSPKLYSVYVQKNQSDLDYVIINGDGYVDAQTLADIAASLNFLN